MAEARYEGWRWRAALAVALAVHLGITAVALVQHGWMAPFPPFDEWRTTQIFSDLACMGLACLVLDARTPGTSRGRTAALAVGIVTLGSIPVLAYLLAEPWFQRDAPSSGESPPGPGSSPFNAA